MFINIVLLIIFTNTLSADSFFLAGEYPEPIKYYHKNWSLLAVAGEEDVDKASMTFAITYSKDKTTMLALLWSEYACAFQIRYPSATTDYADAISINNFYIDNIAYTVETMTFLQLIDILKKGKTLVIDEITLGRQEYSLAGSYQVLKNVMDYGFDRVCNLQ